MLVWVLNHDVDRRIAKTVLFADSMSIVKIHRRVLPASDFPSQDIINRHCEHYTNVFKN